MYNNSIKEKKNKDHNTKINPTYPQYERESLKENFLQIQPNRTQNKKQQNKMETLTMYELSRNEHYRFHRFIRVFLVGNEMTSEIELKDVQVSCDLVPEMFPVYANYKSN